MPLTLQIYHQSTSIKSAMAKKGKKRRRGKYKSLKISRTKGGFFCIIKSIFDNFLKVILMAKIEIMDTSFNCQNKTLYIKNLMHTYKYILTIFATLTCFFFFPCTS